MSRKPHNRSSVEPGPCKRTAQRMADAVSYLCRVAAEEGFDSILPELLEAQQKLERIASARSPAPRKCSS